MNNVEERTRSIIKKVILNDEVMNMKVEDSLDRLGINSVSYIKIVIELENEFDIEFDDDCLNYESFKSVKNIVDYINTKINA